MNHLVSVPLYFGLPQKAQKTTCDERVHNKLSYAAQSRTFGEFRPFP
jgi:hypothetical protein